LAAAEAVMTTAPIPGTESGIGVTRRPTEVMTIAPTAGRRSIPIPMETTCSLRALR
jgi:hypothetical protein